MEEQINFKSPYDMYKEFKNKYFKEFKKTINETMTIIINKFK